MKVHQRAMRLTMLLSTSQYLTWRRYRGLEGCCSIRLYPRRQVLFNRAILACRDVSWIHVLMHSAIQSLDRSRLGWLSHDKQGELFSNGNQSTLLLLYHFIASRNTFFQDDNSPQQMPRTTMTILQGFHGTTR